jgi:acetyl esterase/lipase
MTYDPVTQDPSTSDPQHPPALEALDIPSGGVNLLAWLYLAQGAGPHPTVIYLHGFPGYERGIDLQQVLRRAGWNALGLHYRGAWGCPGDFAFTHALEDVAAALAWARTPAARERYRVDASRLVLIGHSMGGFAALMTAARDADLAGVAAIAPLNLGLVATAARGDPAMAERGIQMLTDWGLRPLRGMTARELVSEAVAHADEWNLLAHAPALARQRLLLVGARQDEVLPPPIHHQPLLQALLGTVAGAGETPALPATPRFTCVELDADHGFSARRIALAHVLVEWLRAEM